MEAGQMVHAPETISDAIAQGLRAADDPPRSGDAFKSAATYAGLSDDFCREAWKHLREDGDLPQTSNQAWGMVAETVKAIGARHGGIIHTHRSIMLVARELARLVRESGDAETAAWINNAFRTARGLHANCYEDEESTDEVADGVQLSEQLSDRLYRLFWPAGQHPENRITPKPEEYRCPSNAWESYRPNSLIILRQSGATV